MYWIRRFFSNPHVHGRAFVEVFCVCLFSLAPLAASLFSRSANDAINSNAMSGALASLFGRGQMYLMAYALFGTVFWLAFLNPQKDRHNARAFLGFCATILMLPVIGFLGVDPTFSTLANPEIVKLGYYLYLAFALIYYLLIFYTEIQPPSPNDVFERETDTLIDDYGRLVQ